MSRIYKTLKQKSIARFFFINQVNGYSKQCKMSMHKLEIKKRHISYYKKSPTCRSLANLCSILSSNVISGSFSPIRRSTNLFALDLFLYSTNRVSFRCKRNVVAYEKEILKLVFSSIEIGRI